MSDPNQPLPPAPGAPPPVEATRAEVPPIEVPPIEAPPIEARVEPYSEPRAEAPDAHAALAVLAAHPVEAPVPSGAPYRVPAPPPPPPELAELALPWVKPPRKPRPIIGPALSVFAVLLWTFVVAGQFTTSWLTGTPLDPKIAFFLIVVATLTAWIAGIRRSRMALPPRQPSHLFWRSIGIATLAFLFFFFSVVAATVGGSASSGNQDLFIAFALVVVSLVAAIVGPRLTSPAPVERTHRQRFVLIMMWIAGVVITLVAGAELTVHG